MTLVVPTTTVADIAASTSASFDALASIFVLLLSVPVAFYIMRRILALFPKPRKK